ncbi:MAG: hypothetical protein FWE02_02920 [Defluviitaleaceae bacterium]|nr:hypothetical protein [Defluviitaleaceae bacterium]
MYSNTEISWRIFENKFSGRETTEFERLAYSLFCAEYGLEWGIFGYRNQTGIEKEPINNEDKVIGFQSKYYEPQITLSSKKSEFIKMINKSKRENKNLTHITVYVNKEFSESSTNGVKKPKYQDEIETHAKNNGIEIIWKTKSIIEGSLFNNVELSNIRDYFFNRDGNREFLEAIQSHKKSIIDSLNSSISYRGQVISISRPVCKIDNFIESDYENLVIYGESGTGKSGMIRDFILKNDENYFICIFRSTDFKYKNILEFSRQFGNISIDEFLSCFENSDRKVIIIDAVEKMFSFEEDENILLDFINKLKNKGWKIIFTIRTLFKDNFVNYIRSSSLDFFEATSVSAEIISNELSKLEISMPKDNKLSSLISNLFYLSLYIETYDEVGAVETKEHFYSKIWNLKIRGSLNPLNGSAIPREEFVFAMFNTIIDNNSYYYSTDNNNIADLLVKEYVISYNEIFKGYSFTHDVFEEMVARTIIKQKYGTISRIKDFFSSLVLKLPMRRHYRQWLIESLEETFISKISLILSSQEIDKIWRDETLIALMSIKDTSDGLSIVKEILAQNDFELLFRAVFLLNTTCRVIDTKTIEKYTKTSNENKVFYRFTQPSGVGWDFVIKYIFENLDKIEWNNKNCSQVIEILTTWVMPNKEGNTTKFAGKIALYLYNLWTQDKYSFSDRDLKSNLFNVIVCSAYEIKNEIVIIIDDFINNQTIDKNSNFELCESLELDDDETKDEIINIFGSMDSRTMEKHQNFGFCEYLISDIFNSFIVCEVIPNKIIELCNKFWSKDNSKRNLYYAGYKEIEEDFGLSNHLDFRTTSAFKTPILKLLKFAPREAIDFIVEFINYASIEFHNSDWNKEHSESFYISAEVEEGIFLKQLCSERLWELYRGTTAGPYLLACILMALESVLLDNISQLSELEANNLCKLLLKKTNNVAITSVITSVVIANPEKLFPTALWLVNFREVFIFDIRRLMQENTANFLRNTPYDKIFNDERIKSNNLPFRKSIFEDVIRNYQIKPFGNLKELDSKRNQLYAQIDKLESKISIEDTTLRYCLNRIDLRKYKLTSETTIVDGKEYIVLAPDEEDDLKQLREQSSKEHEKNFKYLDLHLWSSARSEKNIESYSKYILYEENPVGVIDKIQEFLQDKDNQFLSIVKDTHIFCATVLLRDFNSLLDEKQIEFCCNVIMEELQTIFSLEYDTLACSKLAIIEVIPFLISKFDTKSNECESIIIAYSLALLTDFSDSQKAKQIFLKTMWNNYSSTAHTIFLLFINLISDFNKSVLSRQTLVEKISVSEFKSKHKKKIKKIIKNKETEISPFLFSKLNDNELGEAIILIDVKNKNHYDCFIQISGDILKKIFYKETHTNRNEKLSFELIYTFIDWLVESIYFSSEENIDEIINLIMSNVSSNSSYFEQLLTRLLFKHDIEKDNNKFWYIWYKLFPYIENLCEKDNKIIVNSDTSHLIGLAKIVSTYCFAWEYWDTEQKEWFGVKNEHLVFFGKISKSLGNMPAILYSLARFLNTIGSPYILEGFSWINTVISENPHLENSPLPTNTIHYLEEILLELVITYRSNVVQEKNLRNEVLTVSNYLVGRGSTVGFLIREELF